MTITLRTAGLLGLCVLLASLTMAYQSFVQLESARTQVLLEKNQEVAQFAGQSLQQKLNQMESSASYLDQSTIETLKRLGVRYFAYAYEKKGRWRVKWKRVGELDKDGILSEVEPLPFAKMSHDKRHWYRSKNKENIYVVPVPIASSHQLKDGFLVFGIGKDFFSGLNKQEARYFVLDREQNSLSRQWSADRVSEDFEFNIKNETTARSLVTDSGHLEMTVASFLPLAQLWVVHQSQHAQASFWGSPLFFYALIFSLLLFAILLFFMNGAKTRKKEAPAEVTAPTHHAIIETEEISAVPELILDFSYFLDSLLASEKERLQQVGVSIKTQVVEGAEVFCNTQQVRALLQRLVGNSVLCLEEATEKEIQIQLAEQSDSYQLIYVDSREDHFPVQKSLSSSEKNRDHQSSIDEILSYARFTFGEALTVAKQGFCLSIDLPKNPDSVIVHPVEEPRPLVDDLERIEIPEEDVDLDWMVELSHATQEENDNLSEEPLVSFDEVVEQFRMKEFNFKESQPVDEVEASEPEAVATETSSAVVDLEPDSQGLVELNTGSMKLKIRSPKKRDSNVNN
jgi:dsDNA-binding SOS-regulon protein